MKAVLRGLVWGIVGMAAAVVAVAQAPGGAGQRGQAPAAGRGPARVVLSVTSPAWPDGGEVPMRNAGRGENKSPAFEFHWTSGTTSAEPPENLKSYAVIFHDIENSTNRGTLDTLHWSAFNIPGTAKGLPEGLGAGELPDGTKNGLDFGERANDPILFLEKLRRLSDGDSGQGGRHVKSRTFKERRHELTANVKRKRKCDDQKEQIEQ